MKTIFMPKKLGKKWLKALRSGEFKQGRWVMYDPNAYTFCCLGVLQYVADKGRVEHDGENFLGVPSIEWLKQFGITFKHESSPTSECVVAPTLNGCGLPKLNDLARVSFKDLADMIEQHMEFTE